MIRRILSIFTLTVFLLEIGPAGAKAAAQREAALFYDRKVPAVRFAAEEIGRELKAANHACTTGALADLPRAAASLNIVLVSTPEQARRSARELGVTPLAAVSPQSYSLRRKSAGQTDTYIVLAADAAGAMYGGLDLAEAIRLGTLAELKDSDHAPYIARRGIKFNIPLDARTPSYSDAGDAAQQNIPEMWSRDFWHEMLDEMARQRFNVLSLWNLHPFPSLVKVPEYPDVALSDVMRTTVKFDASYSLSGTDMVRPAALAHLETVKKMTIDEKIAFWREVMQYAHDRGIDVYLFTWNIFVWGAEGKYGITGAQNNPVTIDYFRKSVRQTLLTYPLLAGLGITAGENMHNLRGEFSNEALALEDLRRGDPRREEASARTFHPPHPSAARDGPHVDRRRVEGLSRHVGFQLQVLGGPHVLVADAAIRRADPGRTAGEPADVDDRAQRRHLQFPLGRSRLCSRVHPRPAGAGETGGLLHGAGRLHLGPRVHQHANPTRRGNS